MIIRKILNLINKGTNCTFEYSIHSKNDYSKKPLKIYNTDIVKKYIESLSKDIDDILDIWIEYDQIEHFMIYRKEDNFDIYEITLDGTKGEWILQTSKEKVLNLLDESKFIFHEISLNPEKYTFKRYRDRGR